MTGELGELARPAERCSFWTVPDPSVWGRPRIVVCGKTPSEHPVIGIGRFVNHQYAIDSHGKRVVS